MSVNLTQIVVALSKVDVNTIFLHRIKVSQKLKLCTY